MPATHLELLVEEPSMEAFLGEMLPKMLQGRATFAIRAFQGKHDLLRKLEQRLRGYAHWLPESSRIIVLLDRDDDDCHRLKQAMEQAASLSGLSTRSMAGRSGWRVANRIAVEELEAWFFGDWAAVHAAYPRVSATVPAQAAYRNPDAIKGGTWEAFERVLKAAGYFNLGLRKVEAARAIGGAMRPDANTSRSFAAFRAAVLEAVGS
ncbi:hypothetical protein CCS01_30820 [Rhodopila globiformis]|uniref:DUF4276 domain-containing protein n=2 Tax=Rhodopila globiformis TaxID=1071 RepID=A0A2S6MV68_RHOGL|nr:DUF4276 family protein [Rhodopila globiformis]PPQ26256.1 hypothetical protein CCS01_30820 [Rhodopila globiformis]